VGLFGVAALMLAVLWDAVEAAPRRPGRRHLSVLAALAAGAVAASPTYLHLLARAGSSEVGVGVQADAAGTLFVSMGPLLGLAAVGVRTITVCRRLIQGFIVGAIVLVIANAGVRLPGSNESDLAHVAAVLLAVPAAGVFGAMDGWTRSVRRTSSAALVLVLGSTPAVVLAAYANRGPVALVLDRGELRATPQDSPRARLYEWARSATPREAVFIVTDEVLESNVLGNVPEFPALTHRVVFVAREPEYIVWPNADYARRRDILRRLAAAEPLEPDDRRYLDALGRPTFFVTEAAGDSVARLVALHGPPRFTAWPIAVFGIR
jgi:hypothetical protein